MTGKKFNYHIIFKTDEMKQKDEDYIIKEEEINEFDEIRELNEIVAEINEPEKRYLTST